MGERALLSMSRPSRHEYFMDLADAASRRGTCDRARVGCVLVKDDRIITTGYNGSPPDLPHCDDVGHDMVNGHCIRTIHAEVNAVIQAAFFGASTRGAVCYCTTQSCARCVAFLYSAGVSGLIYRDAYATMSESDEARIKAFTSRGFTIDKFVRREDENEES